ncbi:hypothetical protein HC931_10650 [Candidatus Gracilibacteria bacterium]|nr:hypothetical protein [Candidatus Gracilibacteria bacterium]NJM90648.1 hypothetical protein [Hydrococcus sp. RU_2_2]NJP20683.1 hypothetical protein [Hydrococcus sp. CRU_1_1]
MPVHHKSQNRTTSSPENHRWGNLYQLSHLKKIAIISILIALGIGLALVNPLKSINTGRFVSNSVSQESDSPLETLRERSQSSQPFKSVPALYDAPEQASNSKVGRPLSEAEKQAIAQILRVNPPATPPLRFEQTPKFILHDTSGELSDEAIYNLTQQSRGPLGLGIAAFVSRDGKVTLARSFFDPRRPTATVYEKSADILSETARNQEIRRVWQSTEALLKQATLNQAVAGLNLNVSLVNRAAIWLNAPSERAFEAMRSQTNLDGGKTTGIWAISNICDNVLMDRDRAVRMASSPQTAKTLQTSCQKLNSVLSETRKRVASSVHVEINQMRGSECYTSNAQVRAYNAQVAASARIGANSIVPLQTWDRPAYTDEQYQKIALLYLQSALIAGQFPEITTHYWVDQGKFGKIGTHCDPRGFNLTRLYQEISLYLGNPPEMRYGIEPRYGLHPEKGDNVWWLEAALDELPPSAL